MPSPSRLLIAGLVLLGHAGSIDLAQAGAPTAWMQPGQPTTIPIGHFEFCKMHRQECMARPEAKTDAKLSASRYFALIARVNEEVNASIRPVPDSELYGVKELWTYPTVAGDCEDFALLKRRKLMENGLPASALLLTTVRKPDGEGHAVLAVRLDTGDVILDNLDNAVKPWVETSYQFIKQQSAANPSQWLSLGGGAPAISAAVSK